MKGAPTPLPPALGFSLVEVMVAVVVICVGLLGIAKMQAMAVSNTNMSRQRSLAAIEAASIASAMHSNREYWAGTGTTGLVTPFFINIVSGTPAGAPPVVTSSDASLLAQTTADIGPPAQNPCIGSNNGTAMCSPAIAGNSAALAAFDLARWWNALAGVPPTPGLLPSPVTVNINCPGAPLGNPAPASCTVMIQWIEKAVAMNSQEAAREEGTVDTATTGASAAEQPVFTLYVEP
jgi:type IV pilus assembly protein PilV